MTRGLPWSNHLNPTGERPLFFVELGFAHQTVSFGLYDLVPGPIQGRVVAWDEIFYQHRGGQDDVSLKLVNAPFNAMGKAIRCAGRWEIDTGPSHDGSFAYWAPTTGTPFAGLVDHAFMVLARAWMISTFPSDAAGQAFIVYKDEHFRFRVSTTGTIVFEMNTGSGWEVAATDTDALKEGELCALGFSYVASTKTVTYLRRSDSGDFTTTHTFVDPDHLPGSSIVFNGDSEGVAPSSGAEGRYCAWIDFDEARFWNRTITPTEFNACARRTLTPSEAFDANLVAWSRFDEGTGTTFAVVSRTGASVTGTLAGENTGGLFSTTPAPSWISGLCRDRITDHISAAYPIEGASVTLKICFTDPVTTSPATIFSGIVSELTRADVHTVELDVVDISSMVAKILGTLVTKAAYPKAPNDSVGKMIPLIFGALSNVPGLRVSAGAQTRVAASFLTGDTSMSVADTTDFPASGTLRVDEEEIAYTGKTSTTFTGLTRGSGGTIATSHVTGAQCTEVTGETHLFADHALSSLTNVRLQNSRGELIPADPTEYAVTLTSPARVTFTKPPRVLVRGEGSLWLEIDLEAASPYDNSIDAAQACALNAAWTETNFATINASKPKLSIRRTTPFDGPALSAGVLKAYVVVEHHGLPSTGGPTVTVLTALGDVPLGTLGVLTNQTNTPDAALQKGKYHAESAGFDAAHQHAIPGGTHDHNIGQDSNSIVIRPLGSNFFWAIPSTFGTLGGGATNTNYPTYTASEFYSAFRDQMTDGDQDTAAGFGTFPQAVGKLTFANLTGTKRAMRRARIVVIASGNATSFRFDLVVKGLPTSGMGLGFGASVPMGNTAAGTAGRTTYLSPYVDLTSQNWTLADLIRPDSFIMLSEPGPNGPTMNVWEVYLELEVDQGTSSRIARPAYDNWPKALDKMRDGSYSSFEPHVWPCVATGLLGLGPLNGAPFALQIGAINPNPPINGPDLPFNTQVQPTLRCFFTELDEPFAELQEANVIIAHSNAHAIGPHMANFTPSKLQIGIGNGFQGAGINAPAIWNPLTGAVVGPRYLARLVIKGVTIASFNFSLDMTDAATPVFYDPATAPSGVITGAYSRPAGPNGLPATLLGPGGGHARVESSSGWKTLLGQAPGGQNFKVQDLIDPNSYIEIVLPAPTPLDMVDQISPGPPVDPLFARQFSVYDFTVVGGVGANTAMTATECMKLFDVRIEFRSEQIKETALTETVGPTDAQDALRHSSLTWFDVTSFWVAVNDWSAITNLEFDVVGAFGATEFLRVLRVGVVIEYGVVGEEDAKVVVADCDQGGGGNPIDHVERVFDTYLGSSYKNAAAFTAAKALVRTDAAGIVNAEISSTDLIDKILRQYSCSWFWENGKFVPLFKPLFASIGAGSVTLDDDEIAANSVVMTRTPRSDVFNRAEVNYARDLVKGGWGGGTTRNSTASQTAYGIIRKILDGDWIQSSAAAQAWGDTELEYADHVGVIVTLATYLNGLDLSRGDIVQIAHALRTTTKAEVLELAIHPGGRSQPPTIRFVLADRMESL